MTTVRLVWTTTRLAVLMAAVAMAALAVVPRAAGYQGQIVLSGSMQPALKVGDIAYYRPAADPIRVGDVIAFHPTAAPESLVAHRVVAVRNEGHGTVFVTKGDANAAEDSDPTERSQVVGRLGFRVPLVGRFSLLLHSRRGYWAFGTLIMLMVLVREAPTLIAAFRGHLGRHPRSGLAYLAFSNGAVLAAGLFRLA